MPVRRAAVMAVPAARRRRFRDIGLVYVSMHLVEEQQKPGENERKIARSRQCVPNVCAAPGVDDDEHHAQCRDLPEFDADVEPEDFCDQPGGLCERQGLELGRQTKTVHQSEDEDHRQQVRRRHVQELLKPAEILETLVNDGERNKRIDQVMIGGNARNRRADQHDGVSDRKRRYELDDLDEIRQEKNDAGQKQQVVVAGEHVLGAGPDEIEPIAGRQTFPRRRIGLVRPRGRRQQDNGQKREKAPSNQVFFLSGSVTSRRQPQYLLFGCLWAEVTSMLKTENGSAFRSGFGITVRAAASLPALGHRADADLVSKCFQRMTGLGSGHGEAPVKFS